MLLVEERFNGKPIEEVLSGFEGFGLVDTARHLGVRSKSTVWNWRGAILGREREDRKTKKMLEIETRFGGETIEELIEKHYVQGKKDSREFANLLGVGSTTAKRWIRTLSRMRSLPEAMTLVASERVFRRNDEETLKMVKEAVGEGYLDYLENLEREVIVSGYLLDSPLTYTEIGAQHGLSRKVIRRINRNALAKLRQLLAGTH